MHGFYQQVCSYIPHTQDVHLSESSPLGSASSEHGYAVLSYETEVYTYQQCIMLPYVNV